MQSTHDLYTFWILDKAGIWLQKLVKLRVGSKHIKLTHICSFVQEVEHHIQVSIDHCNVQ